MQIKLVVVVAPKRAWVQRGPFLIQKLSSYKINDQQVKFDKHFNAGSISKE